MTGRPERFSDLEMRMRSNVPEGRRGYVLAHVALVSESTVFPVRAEIALRTLTQDIPGEEVPPPVPPLSPELAENLSLLTDLLHQQGLNPQLDAADALVFGLAWAVDYGSKGEA